MRPYTSISTAGDSYDVSLEERLMYLRWLYGFDKYEDDLEKGEAK